MLHAGEATSAIDVLLLPLQVLQYTEHDDMHDIPLLPTVQYCCKCNYLNYTVTRERVFLLVRTRSVQLEAKFEASLLFST